jgi:hypothetical protein
MTVPSESVVSSTDIAEDGAVLEVVSSCLQERAPNGA